MLSIRVARCIMIARHARDLGQMHQTLLLILLSIHDLDHLIEQDRILSLYLAFPLLFHPIHAILALTLRASSLMLRRLLLVLLHLDRRAVFASSTSVIVLRRTGISVRRRIVLRSGHE